MDINIAALAISITAIGVACYSVHCQMRITRYTYLANKWYDIKDKELDKPDFTDPKKTTSYRTSFKGDSLREYEIFAWTCWGHGEDVYLNKWPVLPASAYGKRYAGHISI